MINRLLLLIKKYINFQSFKATEASSRFNLAVYTCLANSNGKILRTIFLRKILNYFSFNVVFVLILISYILSLVIIVVTCCSTQSLIDSHRPLKYIMTFLLILMNWLEANSLLAGVPILLLILPFFITIYAISLLQTLHKLYCAKDVEIAAQAQILLRIGAKAFAAIPIPTTLSDAKDEKAILLSMLLSNSGWVLTRLIVFLTSVGLFLYFLSLTILMPLRSALFNVLIYIHKAQADSTIVLTKYLYSGKASNLFYSLFYFDGINLTFCTLTTFFFTVAILMSWRAPEYKKSLFFVLLLVSEILTLIFFLSNNLLLFFIAFELVLIPLSLLISNWGTGEGRVHAVFLFFFYTVLASLPFLLAIVLIFHRTGSIGISSIAICAQQLTAAEQTFVVVSFFLAFAVKIPVFPLHTWLTEAHVEASTPVSVVLASVMLKTGLYAFIKLFLPLHFIYAKYLFIFNFIILLSILYASFAALVQVDIKKIVAYTSISHMNFALFGLLIGEKNTILATLMIAIGHAIISSSLFFLIGCLYDRFHVKNINYYGGIAQVMPVFSTFFFIFLVANSGFPLSISFFGEFTILFYTVKHYGAIGAFVLAVAVFLNLVINMKLFVSICFNVINTNYISKLYWDLTLFELIVLILLTSLLIYSFFFMVPLVTSTALDAICYSVKINSPNFF